MPCLLHCSVGCFIVGYMGCFSHRLVILPHFIPLFLGQFIRVVTNPGGIYFNNQWGDSLSWELSDAQHLVCLLCVLYVLCCVISVY